MIQVILTTPAGSKLRIRLVAEQLVELDLLGHDGGLWTHIASLFMDGEVIVYEDQPCELEIRRYDMEHKEDDERP